MELLLVTILLAATSAAALADRGPARGGWHSGGRTGVHSRLHFGIFLGAPLAYRYRYPYYAVYPPAYAYYPPVFVAPPASPPVYIEQAQEQQPQAQQAQASWWYYCAEAKGYYPYVQQCPGGWQRVAPRPAE